MATGVLFPVIILLLWEIYASWRKIEDPKYQICKVIEKQQEMQAPIKETSDNTQSLKVLGYGIAASGALIMALGLLNENGRLLVCTLAAILIGIGGFCIYKAKHTKKK